MKFISAALLFRQRYPRWGKDKLAVLLKRDGIDISVSRWEVAEAHQEARSTTAADFPIRIAPLNQALRMWENVYNTVRPHQASNYLTPNNSWINAGQRKI